MSKSHDAVTKCVIRARVLVEQLRALQAQTYEVTEEVLKILAGDVAMGDQLKEFEAHFSVLWEGRYGSAFAWQYTKDRPHTKRLIKLLGLDELKVRARVYLRDEDPFYTKCRHGFGLFVTNVNRFAAPPHVADLELAAPPVADCAHQPACRSDQEHTKRTMTDLRGARTEAQ